MIDNEKRLKLLLELRPALDGHAGIPQESRLLFRGLSLLPGTEVEGLIQSSVRRLAKGLPVRPGLLQSSLSKDRQVNRLSRVVVSLHTNTKRSAFQTMQDDVMDVLAGAGLLAKSLFGGTQSLGVFDPEHFRDFIWRSLFARTLPYADFDLVTRAQYRVLSVPWTTMQAVALITKKFAVPIYPKLDTSDFDVMIAQTPYPGIVSRNTRLVVRYHDAIPIMMPHTISDRAFHQASHYYALRNNVSQNAHFACVSDATRNDLLSIFPAAEARAITIHNMVSHHYYDEASSTQRIGEIIRTRELILPQSTLAGRKGLSNDSAEDEPLFADGSNYLLIVSTIEPRKNHLSLLSAWEQIRVEKYPNLKLVTVGMLGWDHENITKKFRPWLQRGELFMLEDVPAPELRLLYKHAAATICPSFGEGFDFSGVESMRCGGVVAASDIPVHREIYGQAAEYFSPYSATETVQAIYTLIDPANAQRRAKLVRHGAETSARYLPEVILPKWQTFLDALKSADKSRSASLAPAST
jgi:glycosyltransferase involved in cell wall biosynthesis